MGKSVFSASSPDPAADRLAPLLGRLVNYERSRPVAPAWSLEAIAAVLARPGAVPLTGAAVQVGGSKGKGSTCMFLEALGIAAGLCTGTYLSPHVDTLLERVRVRGQLVGIDDLEAALRAVLDFAGQAGLELTFFEAMTAAAVTLFAAERLDLAILEVGLGGRLDATTAVPVQASILTGVELEHTEILGTTLAEVAGEKAHVIRPGGVCFAVAEGPGRDVFAKRARAVGARLHLLGEDFGVVDHSWQGCDLVGRLQLPDGVTRDFRLLDGRGFELQALALAAACFHHLFTLPLALDPFPRPALPGRFEVVPCADGQPLVLDGAHTEASLAAVATEIDRRWPGQRLAVLFGCAAHKRWQQGLSALVGMVDRVVVTGISGIACEDPNVVSQWLRQRGIGSEVVSDAAAGLRALAAHAGPRLVTGSFHLVSEARRALQRDPS